MDSAIACPLYAAFATRSASRSVASAISVDVEAPATDGAEALGAASARFAELTVIAIYGTADPLN